MSGLGGRPEWLGLLDLPQGGQLGGRPRLFSHPQVLLSFVIVYSFGLAYRARMILAVPAVIEFDALIFKVTAHLSVPAVLPALLCALVSAFAVDDHDTIAVFFASHLLALLFGALTEQHWLGGETDAVDELLPGSRGFRYLGTVFLGVRLELGVGFEVFILLDLLLEELLLPVKGK